MKLIKAFGCYINPTYITKIYSLYTKYWVVLANDPVPVEINAETYNSLIKGDITV